MKTRVMTAAIAVLVAFVLILALAMPVSAADISGTITYAPSGSVVGTYVPASTTVCIFTPSTAITAGSTITLTFPAGTALANIAAGDFTIAQVGGAATVPTAIDFDPVARTITLTVAAASLSGDGLGVVTIATSGTAVGDEIRHPTTVTTSGTFSVDTSVGDTGTISNVTFVHDVATKLVFTTQPVGSVSGSALTTQPIVEAWDQYDNRDTTFTGDVVASEDDLGTLTGTLTVTPVAGVATFTDLVYTATADHETFQIDVASGTLTPATSNNVDCNVVATKLVFITQPAGSVSGSALTTQPVVEAQDANNVKDTDYVTNVVASENDPGTLTGTLTVTPVAGVATFTDLVYAATADHETFQIDVASGTLTPATSNNVDCNVVATKFVIIDPVDGTVDAAITVTVEAQDQDNIQDVDYMTDVTLTTTGSATGGGLVDIVAGTGSRDISDQVPETVNLGLTDSQTTGFDVTSTQDVVFALGAINYYTVTSASYIYAMGSAFTVTVTAYDQYGNLVNTDSSTQVTMSSSSVTMAFDGDGNGTFGEVGDDSKTLTAGTFDIQAKDTTVGIGVTITATDPNAKTGTSSAYTIYASGGGGGGGIPLALPPPSPPPLELEMNLWGDITSVNIDEDGVLMESVTAVSPDGRVTLTIAEGTQLLGPDGNPLAELTVGTTLDPPDAPEGYHVIVAFDFGPDGTTSSPPMEIAIQYDPDALPEGVDEANLVIAYYDEAAGEWVFVPGEVDTAANTVTFSADHFTTFAILGAAAPEVVPTPAPSPTSGGGLNGGTWAGIAIGIIGLIGLSIGLILRRRS